MPSTRSRPALRRALVAVVVLLVVAGGAGAYVLLHEPGNVSHPNLEFTHPTVTPPPAPKPVPVTYFLWPRYGYDAARTRFFPGSRGLDPPLRLGWVYHGGSLLEFPPVIYGNTLFMLNDDGVAVAVDKRSGRVIWQNKVGTLAAASPTIGNGLMFASLLSTRPNTGQNPGAGRFVALSQKTGKVVWSRDVPAGTESSPLAWGNTLYFGDQSGTLYALRTTDGHQWWTYHASGAIKGGPSLSDGILYFGDYAGRAYAVRASDGHEVWTVGTNGTHFGFGSGQFYSSPAIAFGRVYMGNTDGRVYSFAAHSGALAWATSTGAYVYASPAVANTPGLGPTVYIGSYDGNFYAFDAQSGSIRWTHSAGGKISGSATIVGDVVYYANLGTKTTAGLDVRSGRQVFSWQEGSFNPVIADTGAIYLTGYGDLFQLMPQRNLPTHAAPAKVPSNHAPPRHK
jgi:outer membrane protein assembly factor BamB